MGRLGIILHDKKPGDRHFLAAYGLQLSLQLRKNTVPILGTCWRADPVVTNESAKSIHCVVIEFAVEYPDRFAAKHSRVVEVLFRPRRIKFWLDPSFNCTCWPLHPCERAVDPLIV